MREWLRTDRVVSKMKAFAPAVEYLFEAPKPPIANPPAVTKAGGKTLEGKTEHKAPSEPKPSPVGEPAVFPLGRKTTAGVPKEPLTIPLENLRKHAVVLAGAGSGKTVLVRRIVEEAALLGVPSIVIDVANDLTRLGSPWPATPARFDEADRAKAARYHETAEIVVWTPGRQDANPLVFEPLPRFADLRDSADELQSAIDLARASLAPMLGVNGKSGDVKSGLLARALKHFADSGFTSLQELASLLADMPPEVREGFAKADKFGLDLAQALYAVMETNPLLRGGGAPLDPAVLLGARAPGKVRVSVVNLSGLSDLTAQQHLVNQLAMTLFTWIKSTPRNAGCKGSSWWTRRATSSHRRSRSRARTLSFASSRRRANMVWGSSSRCKRPRASITTS